VIAVSETRVYGRGVVICILEEMGALGASFP
jgi:hypothetical protein